MIIFLTCLLTLLPYSLPIHHEVALAGNYGEPRPHHFHEGVDFKTKAKEGLPLFATADGYVSLITVGIGGYGNALYIAHPDGNTTMYCHLKAFTPLIERILKKKQYEAKKPIGRYVFEPSDCPIVRGQLVAVSGNTGASQAPHLHLEMHRSTDGTSLDPLNYLGSGITDHTPPMAHSFMAYPEPGNGVFNGGTLKQSFPFSAHQLSRPFTAWGKVGFGLWANDYMEATYNRYGVKHITLSVDGKMVFESSLDSLPANSHAKVGAWGDFEHFIRSGVWYMRSYTLPGLKLPCIQTDNNLGVVNFCEERSYRLTYSLADFKGNTSTYSFIVQGKRSKIPTKMSLSPLFSINHTAPTIVNFPGGRLTVLPHSVADYIVLEPRISMNRGRVEKVKLMQGNVRLFRQAQLALRVAVKPGVSKEKYYIYATEPIRQYIGRGWQYGMLTASIKDLGRAYEVGVDTHPPLILPVGTLQAPFLRLGVVDKESGLARYEAYIDGQYILFSPIPKSQWIGCKLPETPIRPTGTERRLTVIAYDHCNNKSVYTTTIYY